MKIQLKRGEARNRTTLTPDMGEPIMTTDTKELYIGDGSTPGGVPVGTVKPTGAILDGALAIFSGATGKLIRAISKSDFLREYATTEYVNGLISGQVPGIKVDSARLADDAKDAQKLNGHADYLRQNVISPSVSSSSTTTVASSSAVKATYDYAYGAIEKLKGSINALSSKVNSLANSVSSIGADASAASSLSTQVRKDLTDHIRSVQHYFSTVNAHERHLKLLPSKISSGRADPTGGVSGDVYIQY